MTTDAHSATPAERSSVGEVFLVFLKLGLTSFGGPVAHLGYFRDEFVARRKWLDERAYADLVALCQFLPGRPAARSASRSGICARARGRARRMDRLHAALGPRSRRCSPTVSRRSAMRRAAAGCTA